METYDIGYMERTRQYYRAQGYRNDYQWASFTSVPFTRPERPLDGSRIALITTAMPAVTGDSADPEVTALSVDPPPESLCTDHLSWDKDTTHTRDVPTFLPIEQVNKLVAERFVGELGPRFFCVPTEYSKRLTMEQDAPRILALCEEDQVDLALLVPL